MAQANQLLPVRVQVDTLIYREDEPPEEIAVKASGFRKPSVKGLFLVYYEEEEEIGRTQNVVKLDETDKPVLRIVRSGGLSMQQTYVVNETTEGQYEVPWGQWLTTVKTEDIHFKNTQSQPTELLISYLLDIGGAGFAKYRVKITITEEEHEHD
ncbi:DUF1934 domain-containing protein [Bacillaceae bacterium SIJ1]|uniref:DUF1934 domain-containing protein n=1 Tax=Litoribacterium kuwaitense TaxID=1398745 RepID=UPI0013EDE426|nr:DUF1934 domain-containing protein [Litoribacterium kuwaitense]NGP44706.1 DUF1934 domain-containing protein [Litoribacterium kuwaitense]